MGWRDKVNYPKDWNPPHVIAWRAIWSLPTLAALVLLCLLVGVMGGPRNARRVWREIAF